MKSCLSNLKMDEEDSAKTVEDNEDQSDAEVGTKKKPSKPGVIYLSTLPPKMNVTQIREYFSQFGEIGRSFLQPQENQRGKKNRVYTEGWIEYKKRRHAKKVTELLNNKPLGGKKKHQNYDFLWNVKYLPGLQWAHINERLAYERISRQQKIRAEIAAAKRETSFFARSVGLSKKLKRKMKAEPAEEDEDEVSDHSEAVITEGPKHNVQLNKIKEPAQDLTNKRLKLYKSLFADE